LYAGCPPGLRVLFAPLDVAIAEDTVLQPDLLVAPASAFTARDLPIAPLLAVEVLSPSTRRFDLSLKRDRYADAGCPSYWVVDPDEPGITAWELGDEGYVRVGHAIGTDELRLSRPYDVTIVPAQLLE
jgi:Uma2 family endonuclease